ncbi:MAG: alpha/beta hydrolase [Pseudomonadota bacterium]
MPTLAPTKPIARSATVNGEKVAYWEWRPSVSANATTMIFAHATGFHSRTYDAIIESFPEHRIISVDMHGHGRSEGGPVSSWQTVIDKMATLLKALNVKKAVGVGHSMGGHVLAHCAGERPDLFTHLILFDPVIFDPAMFKDSASGSGKGEPHPAIRRKRDFANPEAMMERFRGRDPYSLFETRAFEDYCRFGLTETADGLGYELACPPEVEASYYGASRTNPGIHEAMTKIEAKTLVVRAKPLGKMDFKGSPTWPDLANHIPGATDLPRYDRTHFHPFEDSADAANIIRDFLAK